MSRAARHYTIQVSNHPGAWERVPSAEAEASWQTKYVGTVESAHSARAAVNQLSAFYRHVRAFRGATVGRLWYSILRAPGVTMPDRAKLSWRDGGVPS